MYDVCTTNNIEVVAAMVKCRACRHGDEHKRAVVTIYTPTAVALLCHL